MEWILVLLALATFADGVNVPEPNETENTAYGYFEKIGIPTAERILKAEEELLSNSARIVGGVPAGLGQYPYQAGIITDIVGISGRGVCGGALVSPNRVLTAAHCWSDGQHQGWRVTIVLGSILLFTGGTRIESSVVAMHPNWLPILARNDIAVVYLPNAIPTSANIAPVALPSGAQVNQDFTGTSVLATGFGITKDGESLTPNAYLSVVRLQVMSNSLCTIAYPLIIQASHICTFGVGGTGPCSGDTGGPLVATINNTPVLIGISSFFSSSGCEFGLPAGYSRITHFLGFINQHL